MNQSVTTPSVVAAAPRARLASLRHLLDYLAAYKGRWVAAMVALVFTSSMTLLLGQGIKLLIDSGFGSQSIDLLNRAVVILLAVSVLFALGTFIRFYLVSWLGERVSADIRKAVFNHIVTLHPGFFETNRSGEIASRITTDTTLLQTIIGSSISMALRSSLTALGGLVMLFITNAKLMLMVVIAVPLVILPMLLFGRRVKKLSRDSQDSVADVGSYAGEIIQHIKTVQSYTQEAYEQSAFAAQVEKAFAVARSRVRTRALMMSVVMLLVFSLLSLMLWVGGRDVIHGQMSAGDLAAFVFYAMLVAMGVATISEVWGELQRAAGATDRLVELLAVKPEIIAAGAVTAKPTQAAASLQFCEVSFAYPSRPQRKALDQFSLTVEQGQCVALVGPSGAGKSTLFELLQRFYDPQSGRITLGGIDIRELRPQDLREQLAVVAQQPALFTADVATNIRYGNIAASDTEVEQAARAAHADEFIAQLPQGYHSFLGEQGVRLSGGQRQRIAIARAILKDPRILMLDEATSALDSESEFHVQQALNALVKNRTTLVIAHRLSTILHADLICVLDQGRLVASGTHDELLQRSPLYAKLASYQFNEPGA
ncbi:MAG: ATP-binding cassette domain-containing protein [Pseudomonadales bacterium]|nr:ATP-binding cassette domain-containing protein [Pseudomonadales bacterium]